MAPDRAGLTRKRRAGTLALLAAIPVVFVGYFFFYPMIRVLTVGIASGDTSPLEVLGDVAADRTLRGIAWFTFWQAVVSTLLTLAAGLPVAYVIARYSFRGRSVVRALTLVPFVLPTVIVGVTFLSLFGRGGWLGVDLRGSIWMILLAHVFFNFAIVVRGVGSAWEQIDPRVEDAARTLGAGRFRTLREVTLPLLRPAIASASALVFLFSFTSFGVILILGDLRLTTLEVEIWRQATALQRLDVAAVLAIVQLVGVGIVLILYGRYMERTAAQTSLRPAGQLLRTPRTTGDRWLVAGTLAFTAMLLGTPLAILAVRSFRTRDGFGLANYARLGTNPPGSSLFVSPFEAIANSFRFAFFATLIAVAVGLLTVAAVMYARGRFGRHLDSALMLPLGASAVTLGFAFVLALDEPVDLRSSLVLIPIAHALVAIPFVIRSTLPVLRSVQHRLREAAAVLGASPGRAWREVDLPLVSRALIVGAAFAFAISLGEFGATSFVVRQVQPTIPIAIYRLLGQPGAFGQAMAMSVILGIVVAGTVIVIESVRVGTGRDL